VNDTPFVQVNRTNQTNAICRVTVVSEPSQVQVDRDGCAASINTMNSITWNPNSENLVTVLHNAAVSEDFADCAAQLRKLADVIQAAWSDAQADNLQTRLDAELAEHLARLGRINGGNPYGPAAGYTGSPLEDEIQRFRAAIASV